MTKISSGGYQNFFNTINLTFKHIDTNVKYKLSYTNTITPVQNNYA